MLSWLNFAMHNMQVVRIHLILCSSLVENHLKKILLGVLYRQHIWLYGFKFTSNLLSKKFFTWLGYVMLVHIRNITQLAEMFCGFLVKVIKLAASHIIATKSCKFECIMQSQFSFMLTSKCIPVRLPCKCIMNLNHLKRF